MKAIPVLDIMRGVAVHALGGRRDRYLPLETKYSGRSDPVEVAVGLKAEFGFGELYVADLDAILGRGSNFDTLSSIRSIGGLKIMADAGVRTVSDAERILTVGVDVVIAATETITSLEELSRILDTVGADRTSVSLDVKGGRVVSSCEDLEGLNPQEAAVLLEGRGVREMVVIDLLRVGSERGVDLDLVEGVVSSVAAPVLVGGGVRGLDDLLSLKRIGVAGVLLATALYKGGLRVGDIEAVRGGG